MATEASNPWAGSEPFPYASLGGIDKALALAHSMGYAVPPSEAPQDSHSVQLIRVLDELATLRNELDETSNAIFVRIQHSQSADVTSVAAIEAKAALLRELSAHVTMVLAAKDAIIARLQNPFVGDSIEVDAAYHEHVTALFPKIASLIGGLPRLLDNITWIRDLPRRDAQLDAVLDELAAVQAKYQSTHLALAGMQSKLQELANTQ